MNQNGKGKQLSMQSLSTRMTETEQRQEREITDLKTRTKQLENQVMSTTQRIEQTTALIHDMNKDAAFKQQANLAQQEQAKERINYLENKLAEATTVVDTINKQMVVNKSLQKTEPNTTQLQRRVTTHKNRRWELICQLKSSFDNLKMPIK